LVKIG